MVPTFEYNLQVIDDFGASDAESGYVTQYGIQISSLPGLDNGLTAFYLITYRTTGLDASFDNADLVSDVELPNFDGTYSSVGAVTLTPSTTYDVENVNSQTVTLNSTTTLVQLPCGIKIGNLWQLLAQGTPN